MLCRRRRGLRRHDETPPATITAAGGIIVAGVSSGTTTLRCGFQVHVSEPSAFPLPPQVTDNVSHARTHGGSNADDEADEDGHYASSMIALTRRAVRSVMVATSPRDCNAQASISAAGRLARVHPLSSVNSAVDGSRQPKPGR